MAAEFQWINTSNGKPEYDTSTRKLIRAQAMKETASKRKKSGVWNKQNQRQYEVIRCEGTQLARDARALQQFRANPGTTGDASFNSGSRLSRLFVPGRPMPISGFELLVTDVGLNVLDLDELTCISAGQRAGPLLSQNPTILKKLIARRRESYMAHLPARYGTTSCLDHALRYLAIKAKHFLVSPEQSSAPDEFRLYGKALHSLQAAVNDDKASANADVLCAIEILSICEVISYPSRPSAWENHVWGAYRFIGAMGPDKFTTEFEKTLVVSMVAPILSECMRRCQPCFFEEPAWQSVIRSVVVSERDFSPRCRAYYQLSYIGARIPRVFADINRALENRMSVLDADIDALESRCRAIKADLATWRRGFDLLELTSRLPSGLPSSRADMRSEALCTGLIMQSTLCRFLGALSLPAVRVAEEEEAVAHARHMRARYHQIARIDLYSAFYMKQKLVFTDSILATSDMWLQGSREGEGGMGRNDGQHSSGGTRLIATSKFLSWCEAMGVADQEKFEFGE